MFSQKACGERMRRLRAEKKLSQKDVARKLNISVDMYRSFEIGRRTMGIDTLTAAADFFGVSLDYLVRGKVVTDDFLIGESIADVVDQLSYLKDSLNSQS